MYNKKYQMQFYHMKNGIWDGNVISYATNLLVIIILHYKAKCLTI